MLVNITVKDHPIFYRSGPDIHVETPITIGQAILGGTVSVPTLLGEVEIKIPSGTQPNEKRVIKGKGIKKLNSQEYGNLYIHFNVIIPKYVIP